jgi:tetratricopeptide (TPR) repeat protein
MTEQRVYRLLPFAVALPALLVFLPALRNDFINLDDPANFLLNLNYRGLGWTQLKWMWTTDVLGHYIPVTWMTLGLDYSIWGMDPLGYHLTNILWHTANAVVFYFLALALFRRAIPESSAETRARIPLAACFAALLFALHPLRVESVAWVTERRDVVSGLFYLLAILAYVRGFEPPERPIRRWNYWACLACFALAALSKEITITLPVVLLILDVYPLRRLGGALGWRMGAPVRRIWLEKLPFLAISVAGAMRALYAAPPQNPYAALAGLDWWSRAAAAIYSLAFYIWKTLAPIALSPFYPLTPHKIDPWAAPLELSASVVFSTTLASILLRRRFPALLAVWLAYLITLSPVLGIVDNGPQIVADRYSYLACLGWAILAGAALLYWRTGGRAWPIPAAAALVILTLAVLTWRQVPIWRDSETLWTHALAVEPSFVAYENMGGLLMDRGDYLWAADYFRQAIAMKPAAASAHLGLGGAFLGLGQTGEAVREFEIVLRIGQSRDLAENGLASALALRGQLDEAIDHYREALKINPGYEDARRNLEQALARKNHRLLR